MFTSEIISEVTYKILVIIYPYLFILFIYLFYNVQTSITSIMDMISYQTKH